MKVRSGLLVGVMILALFISATAPANAIFGLSKCEKVKKQVLLEEQIGLGFWKVYRAEVKGFKTATVDQMKSLTSSYLLITGSKEKVYQLLEKNKKCFTTAQLIYGRKSVAKITSEQKIFKSVLTALNAQTGTTVLSNSDALIKAWKSTYKKYYSIYDIK